MNVTCKKNKSGSVLTLDGEFTIYAVAQAKKDLFADYQSLVSPVALNVEGVSEIDTAGIQLLLFFKKIMADQGSQVYLSKSNEQVDSQLSLLNVSQQFVLGE